MADSTTRIADLPENITVQMQHQQPSYSTMPPHFQQQMQQGQGMGPGMGGQSMGLQNEMVSTMGQNTYVPMNIHPNPYGNHPPPQGAIPLPQGSPQRGQGQGTGMGQSMGGMGQGIQIPVQMQMPPGMEYGPIPQEQQQMRLPSRDIPMNQLAFQQDEEIQPNYVPPVKLTSDYIRNYERASEQALMNHEQKKYQDQASATLFSQLQVPILVAVLYFVFQMPIVNTFLRKYMSFLSIYHDDGNLNLMGLLFKSVFFGSVFYSMQIAADKVSRL